MNLCESGGPIASSISCCITKVNEQFLPSKGPDDSFNSLILRL